MTLIGEPGTYDKFIPAGYQMRADGTRWLPPKATYSDVAFELAFFGPQLAAGWLAATTPAQRRLDGFEMPKQERPVEIVELPAELPEPTVTPRAAALNVVRRD